ncbi:MAG: hypothetical protein ACE5H5_04575, partial [Nitrospinota bacterium]
MDRGKSRSLFLVLVFGVALLIPTPGFAQVYVGGYVGAAIPHDADTSGKGELSGVSFSDTEFDAGVMVGGRVG